MTDLQSKLQHLNIHRSLTGQWKNKKQKDNYLSKNSEATKQKKKKKKEYQITTWKSALH